MAHFVSISLATVHGEDALVEDHYFFFASYRERFGFATKRPVFGRLRSEPLALSRDRRSFILSKHVFLLPEVRALHKNDIHFTGELHLWTF